MGDTLIKEVGGEPVEVRTPFGAPSSVPVLAQWEGIDVVFVARHGPGHTLIPSRVPYRANIWALKELGVTAIIASGATGSLREDIEPGHLVLCDQVIDKTFRRDGTFFDEGVAVHVEFTEPFCPSLRAVLTEAGQRVPTTVHHAGTYVCMEGPQFSTRAESHMHRQWGGDLIGMTCMPEAKLAREAELCYALIALPTDYDCWRPSEPGQNGAELLREIIANLKRTSEHAALLVREALKLLGGRLQQCRCSHALKLAIWSDPRRIDAATRRRLGPLIGRYLADDNGSAD
jgi:5'-methylthioadenosine phosphorylase